MGPVEVCGALSGVPQAVTPLWGLEGNGGAGYTR